MAGDAQPIADAGHVGKDVERGAGFEGAEALDAVEAVGQQGHLPPEFLHHRIPLRAAQFERGFPGDLHEWWSARERRVDHRGDRIGGGRR